MSFWRQGGAGLFVVNNPIKLKYAINYSAVTGRRSGR
jgi:hypothetical protein